MTTLRRATVEDAQTLSSLAARTFTETFGHLYPAEDLAAFLTDAYAVEKQRTILAHPDYAVWLLEHEGEAIGHAAAGPCGLPHADVAKGDTVVIASDDEASLDALEELLTTDHDA